jgi:hypothetical protein
LIRRGKPFVFDHAPAQAENIQTHGIPQPMTTAPRQTSTT